MGVVLERTEAACGESLLVVVEGVTGGTCDWVEEEEGGMCLPNSPSDSEQG